MVTHIPPGELDLQEQLARIRRTMEEVEKFSAETRKIVAETQNMPKTLIFQAMIAAAALMGAGAALVKLFFP